MERNDMRQVFLDALLHDAEVQAVVEDLVRKTIAKRNGFPVEELIDAFRSRPRCVRRL